MTTNHDLIAGYDDIALDSLKLSARNKLRRMAQAQGTLPDDVEFEYEPHTETDPAVWGILRREDMETVCGSSIHDQRDAVLRHVDTTDYDSLSTIFKFVHEEEVGTVASAAALRTGSAERWESLIEQAWDPADMGQHKVLATDLLQNGELALVEVLRPLMIRRGFAPVDHVSQAVERCLYEAMPAERLAALQGCLNDLGATVGVTMGVLHQFQTLAKWARQRSSCMGMSVAGYRRLDPAAVAAARVAITTGDDFNEVRDSCMLLVGILERRHQRSPPTHSSAGRAPVLDAPVLGASRIEP